MTPVTVAFESVDVAIKSRAPGQKAARFQPVDSRRADIADRQIGGQVGAIARPDDTRANGIARQHGRAGDRCDIGGVAIGDLAQRPQQGLEQMPSRRGPR